MWKSVVKVALVWIMEASAGRSGSAIPAHELAGRRPLQSPWPSLLVLRTFSVLLTFPGLYRRESREREVRARPQVYGWYMTAWGCVPAPSETCLALSTVKGTEWACYPCPWDGLLASQGIPLGQCRLLFLPCCLSWMGTSLLVPLVSLSVQWMSSLPRALPAAKSSRI